VKPGDGALDARVEPAHEGKKYKILILRSGTKCRVSKDETCTSWFETQRFALLLPMSSYFRLIFFRFPRESFFSIFFLNGFSGSRKAKRIGTPGISKASRTPFTR
jgi:hypothetical protein